MTKTKKPKEKLKFDLRYKCANYFVEYKGEEYILSFEWDDIGNGDISITTEAGDPVDEKVYDIIREAFEN